MAGAPELIGGKMTVPQSTAFQLGEQYIKESQLGGEVAREGSFELKSRNITDQSAYSFFVQDTLIKWRNTTAGVTPGFENKLDEIQAYLRGTGLSKDTGNRGIMTQPDLNALKEISSVALANGIPFENLLKSMYAGITSNANAPQYSKQITSAIQNIDITDATNKLSTSYFNTFGEYPTEEQINKFKNDWNAEATRQMASTTTTGVSTAISKNSNVNKTKSITTGEGFTMEEQKQFLGQFLAKNYNFTGAEQSGAAKGIYDKVMATYKNNFLPTPNLKDLIPFIVDVIGTGDVANAQQKIDAKIQSIRNTAAKFNPGIADVLANGEDAKATADAAAKYLSTKLGRTVTTDEPFIYKVMNFNDNGKYRTMNTSEINAYAETLPEWQTSPDATNKYTGIFDNLKQSLGLK